MLKRKKKNEEEDSEEAEQLKKDSSHVASRTLESELSQASEEPSETKNITCQNTKCGKVFNKPLTLIDLAKPSDEGTLVCPHCLTQLEPVQQPEQETVTEIFSSEKSQDISEQKEGECPHFFGYLNKRPKNVPIPDFCLACPQMVKCMLGNQL